MPADDSRELFDVVDELTGEPLFVDDEGGGEVAEGSARAGDEGGEDGVEGIDDDDDAEEGKPSTSRNSRRKKKRLTVPRGVAHSTGTWHASVYVHLSRATDGAFLLQRRSREKDVCPLKWDLACSEHLSSGESAAEAALRGLSEELGLAGISAERLGDPLGPPRQAVLRIEGAEKDKPRVWDREVVRSFWLRNFFSSPEEEGEGEGEEKQDAIAIDEDEVEEVRWVSPSDLREEVESEDAGERFTPWFLAELRARPELLRGGG
jgi:isopentenyldiphosphate isomerase